MLSLHKPGFKSSLYVSLFILLSALCFKTVHAESLIWVHYVNKEIAANTFHTEPFTIETAPKYGILTNVEVQFTYIAYNGYENYVSARINKGSPPANSGGASLVAQGNLPSSPIGSEATYGYKSFSNWNGQSVNDSYYVRFDTASGCPPPGPTIKYVRLRLTCTVINPDFVAEQAYMASISDPGQELTNPKVGDVVTFNFQFRLDDNDVGDSFSIKCYLDNNLFYSTTYQEGASIGRYYPYTGNTTWIVTAGSHSILWVVDADNQIPEAAETNNESSKNWNIAEQFDLVHDIASIRDTSGNPASGYVGETVYFRFDYNVQGQGTTPPFDIRCELDGSLYWTESNVTRTGGQSYSVTSPTAYTVTEGSHTVRWILDSNDEINESNETNNESAIGWTPTNPCTYTISPTNQSFSYQASSGSVQVATESGCSWSSTAPANWVTITNGDIGVGSGMLYYEVAENTSASSRVTTFYIAQLIFTVSQTGKTGRPIISVEPKSFDFGEVEVK